jgi:parvulin-like peptidyl-prolyl isomerase
VKLRRLSHTLISLMTVGLTAPSVMAQTPAAPPPSSSPVMQPAPSGPPPAPVHATPTPQQAPPPPPMPMRLQDMPPPPPTAPPPIDVNSPGIEAKVPAGIKITGIAATVNGKPITYQYLVTKFLAAGAPQFLDEMINEQLIREQAAKEGVVVTKAETDAKLLDAKKYLLPQYPGMSWAQFLALQGRSESYIRDNIYDGLLAVKLVEKTMPPPTLIGKVHLYHILRLTEAVPNGPVPATDAEAKAEIEAIKADIDSGKATFQEEAIKESQDSSASKGGDLGWVGRDASLDKTFAAAAFALKEGETSGPVRSQYGWHLIYAAKFGIHANAQEIAQYNTSEDDRARQQIQPYLKNLHDTAKIVNFVLPAPPVQGMPAPGTIPSTVMHMPMPHAVPMKKTTPKP